jgi:hypothetical protein
MSTHISKITINDKQFESTEQISGKFHYITQFKDIRLKTFDYINLSQEEINNALSDSQSEVSVFCECFRLINSDIIERLITNPASVYHKIKKLKGDIIKRMLMMCSDTLDNSHVNAKFTGRSLSREDRELVQYCVSNFERFVDSFITSAITTIPVSNVIIPSHNLRHIGCSCHLNTCLNILSSMFYLVHSLIYNVPNVDDMSISILKTVILNSYSPIDLNENFILTLANMMQIDINEDEEVDVTMKSLVSILQTPINGEQYIDNSLLLYITPEDTFIPVSNYLALTDRPDIFTQIYTYVPKYFIINPGVLIGFVDYIKGSSKAELLYQKNYINTLNVGEYVYKLYAFILHVPGHFRTIFIKNYMLNDVPHEYRILDDLGGRLSVADTFGSYSHNMYNVSHVLSVYCRIDE